MFRSSHTLFSATVSGTNSASLFPTESESREATSNANGRIRAFPFRPRPEPGSLTDFVEETGTNGILIEALQKLYMVRNKPENPIEWFRLYFKFLADNSTRDMDQLEILLKSELAELEKQFIEALDMEAQNQAIIQRLESEIKNLKLSSTKGKQHEDFVQYLNHPDDYHYRIKPHPSYQASKTDMLLSSGEGPIGSTKQLESINDMSAFDPSMFLMDGETPTETTFNDAIYQDYPITYFSNYLSKPQTATADELDESEMGSEAVEETEYDAGSEGGDSGESRFSFFSRLPTPNGPAPTPSTAYGQAMSKHRNTTPKY